MLALTTSTYLAAEVILFSHWWVHNLFQHLVITEVLQMFRICFFSYATNTPEFQYSPCHIYLPHLWYISLTLFLNTKICRYPACLRKKPPHLWYAVFLYLTHSISVFFFRWLKAAPMVMSMMGSCIHSSYVVLVLRNILFPLSSFPWISNIIFTHFSFSRIWLI